MSTANANDLIPFNEYEEIVLSIYGGPDAESREVLARTEKLCRVVENDGAYVWKFVEPDFMYGPIEATGDGLWVNKITCWNPKFQKEIDMWPLPSLPWRPIGDGVNGVKILPKDTYTVIFKNEALRVI